MSEWISVSEKLPQIKIGDEMHCFVCVEKGGRRRVDHLWYANKPIPDGLDEYDDMPDYVLHDSDGEPIDIVGWCEVGINADLDNYYQKVSGCYGEIIAWQPVVYPNINGVE